MVGGGPVQCPIHAQSLEVVPETGHAAHQAVRINDDGFRLAGVEAGVLADAGQGAGAGAGAAGATIHEALQRALHARLYPHDTDAMRQITNTTSQRLSTFPLFHHRLIRLQATRGHGRRHHHHRYRCQISIRQLALLTDGHQILRWRHN